MADERITSGREAVIAEILGNVNGLEEQIKAIHAELMGTLKNLKDVRQTAIDEIRATGTAERNKLASEAAKQVHDGINSEIDGIKSSLNNLILKTKQASDEIRFQMFRAILLYGLSVGIGVVFVSYIVIRTALNH